MKTVSLFLGERRVDTWEWLAFVHLCSLSQKKTKTKTKKVLLHPFSWITFLRQVNNRDEPESDLGRAPCKATGVNSALLWMYEHHHTCSLRAICFLQCHHRLLQRDSLILSFLYSSDQVAFFFGGGTTHRTGLFYIFAFGCWLTLTGQWVTSAGRACTYCMSRYSCPLHCLFFVLQ